MCPISVSSISWQKHDGKNCYSGNGADHIFPDPYSSSFSLSDCQRACAIDDSCEGIIVPRHVVLSGTLGNCHKRRNILVDECQDAGDGILFIKQTGKQLNMGLSFTLRTLYFGHLLGGLDKLR